MYNSVCLDIIDVLLVFKKQQELLVLQKRGVTPVRALEQP